MKQRAHAWVAVRALKLVEDSGAAPGLVELLCFYLSDVWDGAWLPDSLLVDMAYGHIFKMDTDGGMLGRDIANEAWLRVPYDDLKAKLHGKRLCLELVKDEAVLNVPYASLEDKGGHLPERVTGLSHSIGDMLKMSDYPLAFYAKKKTPEAYQSDLSAQSVKDLSGSPNFSARQIAQMFFIMSHYITDAHMPLHCDLRDFGRDPSADNSSTPEPETAVPPLTVPENSRTSEPKNAVPSLPRRLPQKLHPSIEDEWEKHFPDKDTLSLHKYSKASLDEVVKALPPGSIISIDTGQGYALENGFPASGPAEWTEMTLICRTSFALSRMWIQGAPENVQALIQGRGPEDFARVTNSIFHDAVCTVAAQWVRTWKKFAQ